jgi:hypothetical protein
MKWLILLVLISACTSNKDGNKDAVPAAETSATESDAKPVSPYTVEPCYCMKIYQPVCAGGKNYGNSCEAECEGHKKWTEGACK